MQPAGRGQPQIAAPLAETAARQHGVVSRAQLRALGHSDEQIKGLVARGHLLRLHRAVYAVGHRRLTIEGRWSAAVLACGPDACLSHRDACALHGLQRPGAAAIHVTAPRPRRVAGVRCHTTRRPFAIVLVDAIPVTTLGRTLLDVAPDLAPQRLRSLLEQTLRLERFDGRRFAAELARANGHRGVGRLRAALAQLSDVAPDLRSGLEGEVLELVRASGLPEPAANVLVAGELCDLHWSRERLVVEIDSWSHHRTRRSFDDDRRKANVLALAGQTVLRISDRRLASEPAAVLAELRTALTRRGG